MAPIVYFVFFPLLCIWNINKNILTKYRPTGSNEKGVEHVFQSCNILLASRTEAICEIRMERAFDMFWKWN